ncbi:RNA-binding protein 34-like [Liolophura sinensis]|uniref:RNA-binding protein 34-like n=1 Tax=Liolophura sinensis TaxID=3198878 RepID=UPI00315876E4
MSCPEGYVVGQVANLLSRSDVFKSSVKTVSREKAERKKRKLESLFTVSQSYGVKRSAEQPGTRSERGYSPPSGVVHESVHAEKVHQTTTTPQNEKKRKSPADSSLSKEMERLGPLKRMRRNRRDRTNDERTVFVGNLPTTVTQKALKGLFKTFGEIETVRIRCAPRADLKIPKKLAIIKKEFHPDRHNLAAFVVFKKCEDAQKATALNGDLYTEGFHMRVDLASKDKQHDHQRSVFVGNLPFDVVEADVWQHFQEYGEVENVRLVRDRNTSIGKGFGYVLFKDKSSVSLTLKFGKHQFKGRELRVQQSTAHPVETNGGKGKSDDLSTAQKHRTRPKFKASNITSHSFQGDKAFKKSFKKGHSRKGQRPASVGDVGGSKKTSKGFSETQGTKSTGQKRVNRAVELKGQAKKSTSKKGLPKKGNHKFHKAR